MASTLRGAATINIWAEDRSAAVAWYSKLLNTGPYFERPGYAEYRIGDHRTELGIIDRKYAPHMTFPEGPAGAVLYWHVDDVHATYEHLLSQGAAPLQGPEDRGHGFVTATVLDPFGNILGIMYGPHYAELAGIREKGRTRS